MLAPWYLDGHGCILSQLLSLTHLHFLVFRRPPLRTTSPEHRRSFVFTTADIQAVEDALRLLLSPLDYPRIDDWRGAVNRQLKSLLHADSAGFLLPVTDGLMMFSEEHSPEALSRYPDLVPPDRADGTPIWMQMLRSEVTTIENAYGGECERYLRSAYYNEYAGANGAHDTLCAAVSLGGTDAFSVASLQFWHDHPNRRRFGEREIALLRVLFPAFQAGAHTYARLAAHQAHLAGVLDALNDGVLLCDRHGRVLHANTALVRMLEKDPEGTRLRGTMERMARLLAERLWPGTGSSLPQVEREIRTGAARYRFRGSYVGESALRDEQGVLVTLECLTPELPSEEALRERFGLTPAEARVALRLAEGKTNAEVSESLSIRPGTARIHTERVCQKLGVHSRAKVGPTILQG